MKRQPQRYTIFYLQAYDSVQGTPRSRSVCMSCEKRISPNHHPYKIWTFCAFSAFIEIKIDTSGNATIKWRVVTYQKTSSRKIKVHGWTPTGSGEQKTSGDAVTTWALFLFRQFPYLFLSLEMCLTTHGWQEKLYHNPEKRDHEAPKLLNRIQSTTRTNLLHTLFSTTIRKRRALCFTCTVRGMFRTIKTTA